MAESLTAEGLTVQVFQTLSGKESELAVSTDDVQPQDHCTLRLRVTVCNCACAARACGLQSTVKCVRDFGVSFLSLNLHLTVY